MADHHQRAGPRLEEVLQRPQGVEVEVVGGLVEQQHVGQPARTSSSCSRRRSPPDSVPMGAHWASASNQNCSMRPGLLPVGLGGRRRPRRPAPAGRGRGRRRSGRSSRAATVGPPSHRALGRRQPAGHDVEQRRLARAVGPDDAQPAAGSRSRSRPRNSHGLPSSEAVADAVELDDLVAQAGRGRRPGRRRPGRGAAARSAGRARPRRWRWPPRCGPWACGCGPARPAAARPARPGPGCGAPPRPPPPARPARPGRPGSRRSRRRGRSPGPGRAPASGS